jgi:hypothetical protein
VTSGVPAWPMNISFFFSPRRVQSPCHVRVQGGRGRGEFEGGAMTVAERGGGAGTSTPSILKYLSSLTFTSTLIIHLI